MGPGAVLLGGGEEGPWGWGRPSLRGEEERAAGYCVTAVFREPGPG